MKILRIFQVLCIATVLAIVFTTSPQGLHSSVLIVVFVCIFVSLTGVIEAAARLLRTRLSIVKIVVTALTATLLLALNSVVRLSVAEVILVAILFGLLALTYSKRYISPV